MKQIDCNQLVDTLSAEDISNLEGAADFFSVFCYDQEAFELYTLALKRHQYDGKGRNAEYWSLVLQCVHSATRIEHVEIVQNILREDIRQLKEGKLGVYGKTEPFEFLLHMLMAFACYRNAAMDVVRVNLLKAAAVVDGVEGLSASYRSLHLVLYRNVLRLKQFVSSGTCPGPDY
jgi:hypothetical protein